MPDRWENYDPKEYAKLLEIQEAEAQKKSLCADQIEELETLAEYYENWAKDWKEYRDGDRPTEPRFYEKYPNG